MSVSPGGSAGSTPAAFFDLDRTLIDVNSFVLWARAEWRAGAIPLRKLFRALFWSVMYHLSLVDFEVAFEAALSHYRGLPAGEMQARIERWCEEEVLPRLRPEARAAIEEHRRQGHLLVLLTSSPEDSAECVARAWGFDHVLANRFRRDEGGRLLGVCERPLCYGQGKVTLSEAWALEHGVRLEDSYFYTDSYSDLPMLERVGEPRVVAPDPWLRRQARRRGWPILAWSRGGGGCATA